MRFRVRCGERLAADEYCFDDLLSQMTAPFQNRANTFGCASIRSGFLTFQASLVLPRRRGSLPKRDLPINNKTRALSAAENLRMRAEIRNGETATQTNRLRDNCARHHPPPGSSRLQANKHPAGASSPEARCFCPGSSEKRTEQETVRDSRVCRTRLSSIWTGATLSVHAAASPSSNRRTARISLVDFQFAKVRRLFWPLHIPTYAADEIAFVKAIPAAVPISTNKSQQRAAST